MEHNTNVNLFDSLIKSSFGNNGITFYDNNGSHFLSYNELYNKSLRIAGFLSERVNPTENEIIILIDNNREFVPVFWACIAAKIKAVPVAVGNSAEHKLKLFKVWKNLLSPYIVTSKTIYENLRSFAEQNGLESTFEEMQQRLIIHNDIIENPAFLPGIITENEIAFIQYSSGSTGRPKGVILTHKNLVITISAFIRQTKVNSYDSFLSWFPLTHDMGLIGWHIAPLLIGINQVLIETNLFVRRPAIWMDKTYEHKSTILCSPNFGLKHFLGFTKKINEAEWNLSNVRAIVNGAEPISPKLCEEFLSALSQYGLKHTVMTPGYGLAEVGLISSISDYSKDFQTIYLDRTKLNIGDEIVECEESSDRGLSFVCEGEFIPELSVKMTDDRGLELPEKHVGHINLKGESVTRGYYNNASATKQTITSEGWLDTGDLGFLYNKKIFLTGRSKELIIINGYNYYPHDIERVCLSLDELELGKIVAAGTYEESLDQEVLIIFVYYKSGIDKFIDLSIRIKEILLRSVGLNVYRVIPIKKIPKTTSGKVQRFVLLENYRKGDYNEVISKIVSIQHSKEENKITDEFSLEIIIEKLKTILKGVVSTNIIDHDEALINYGIDSICGTELLGRVKDYFNIEIDEFIYLPDLSISAVAEFVFKTIHQSKVAVDNTRLEPQLNSATNVHQASAGQFSIYYHYKNYPSSSAYNISIACRILSKINIVKLNQAYSYVVNRHEILRAKYFMTDKLCYRVNKTTNNYIEVIETNENSYHSLKTVVKDKVETPFDIENDSVIRSFLYETKNNGFIFLVNLHHIAGDARSLFILLKEILICYNELEEDAVIKSFAPDSPYKYSEYVDEEITYLNGNSIVKAKEYWASNLTDVDFGLNLPTVVKNGKQSQTSSHMFEVELWKNGNNNSISDFTLMLSVYCYLLHRYTRQKEIIVGVPVSENKVISNKKMNEELIGYTINTLPVKSTINNSETISEYLEKMKLTILNAMKHQHYPLSKITEDLNPSRNNGEALFQTMFTALPVSSTNNLSALADSLNEENEIEFGAVRLKPFYIPQQESLFDLAMEMVEQNKRIVFRISYNCSKYENSFVERFASHYKKAIKEFTSSSSTKLSSIEILSSKEKTLLDSFNNTGKQYHNYKPIIQLIEEQAVKTPDNIAYIYDDKQFTYNLVNQKANGLAEQLLKAGIKKGQFVPVFMKTGIELPISILAIMKTGCAFIPLDVDTPERRLNAIINDINPKVILTTKIHLDKLSFIDSSKITLVEAKNVKDVNENLDIEISLDDRIYGIYTSGTTGVPKCAVNLHKGITNKLKFMDDYFGTDKQRVLIFSADVIFDTSVYQLFWPLTHGAKVIIPESSDKLNLDYMLDLIKKYQVTFIEYVPSVFNILVEYFENNAEAENKFRSITNLSIGGEAIVPAFVNRFRKHFPEVKITNIYGPTETAIGITYYDITEKADEIPIGKPMSNAQIFILDENMNRMPVGLLGEIYIGGECVGSGYLNNPHKTADVFVNNIFAKSGKLYKTGDLGCYLTDGNILFKGRADEQVKINGVRIEPEEIRANILNVDFVDDAIVTIKVNKNGETQLVAYVLYKNGNHNGDELKKELLKNLPEILIPQYFVKIDEVPLNANGKLNKRALTEINITKEKYEDGAASRSSKLLNIWREVLSREDINASDKFFNCGGNSLKALLLKIKIQQSYGVELGIEKILSNPSVSQLEEELRKLSPEKGNFIAKVEQREYYPLSNQQKRMWLLCNGENSSNAYGMIGLFNMTGKMDLPVFRKTWELLVERHESLRTKYIVINGEPVQVIEDKVNIEFKDINTGNIESELYNILESEKKYAFDLSELPLFKIIILSDDDNTKVILHFHHIITDGWSNKIMFDELSGIYNGLIKGNAPELRKLSIQYKDYSVWLESERESKKNKEAKEYWTQKLAGELPVTSIPADYEKSNIQNRSGEVKRFILRENITEKIHQFCKEKEITLSMLLISAVEIVLSKYTGCEEVILGTPVSGRNYPELTRQIGLYVNTIILRNSVEKNITYSEFIDELKKEILESYKYQDYPYDKLVEVKSGNNSGDLFEVFVSYEGIEDEIKLALYGTENKYEEIENKESKFNISVMFRERAKRIELVIEYADELYKEERIEKFAAHIEKTLKEIISDPYKQIKSINLLSKDEEKRLLKYAFTSANQEIKWKSVIEQFKETVKENEHEIAVFHKGESLTYKQLDIDSDKVASALILRGLKEESIVGLLTSKSLNMIVGIIGILKTGAAYLPLDPEHPDDRLKMIVKDSCCKVVLTNADKYSQEDLECEVLSMDYLKSIGSNSEIPVRGIRPSQLAYVIYTSGSTGSPKGVMIEHHSLNNLIKSLRDEVYDKYGKRLNVALQASYVFDASIQQIFPTLMRGDRLHLIEDETKLDGKRTAEYFEKYEIDIADATPTLFDLQLRSGFIENRGNSLMHLLVGGEPLNFELLKRFYSGAQNKNVKITNMYGPTECCVDTTCFTITKDNLEFTGIAPIGKPMHNTYAYILNEDLQQVPLGIAGELYLGGENVGRGYVNNDELTNSKFIKSPFDKNNRLYRTGDLCRFSYNGNIIYLGRIDNQIKIRGYRVELGEIENVIEHFAGKSKCIVIYDNEKNELIAFLEKGNSINLAWETLFEKIKTRLPAYMCPAKIVEIDKLPLTQSGKPDRIKLAANVRNYTGIAFKNNYEAPRNETEIKLVEIWEDVLGMGDIGINDNFYELGGHSLKSLKIMSVIVKTFGVEVSFKDVLTKSTIKELAAIIDLLAKTRYKPIPKVEEKEYYDLSHAQKRIWLECELGQSNAYNIVGGFYLSGDLDVELFNKSFRKIFNRHESLRTRFRMIDGQPKQFIRESPQSIVSITDLSSIKNADEILQKNIKNIATKTLNIFRDELVNASLFKTKEKEYFLLALVHHIVTDGWSIKIMLEEISRIYNGYKNKDRTELNELSVQYKDYSAWFEKELKSERFKKAKKYWNKKVGVELPHVSIPAAHKQVKPESQTGKVKRIIFNKELTKAVREYADQKEVTAFIFMLSVVEIILYKYTGSEDIILGTPVSGRNHPDLEEQLGLYVNTIVLRNKIQRDKKYSEFLIYLKNDVLESYNYQDYPYDKLMEERKKRNNLELFSMFVSYEAEEDEIKLNLDGITSKYMEVETGTSKFDISLTFHERKEVIEVIVEYSTQLYDEESIDKLGADIKKVITSVTNNDEQSIDMLNINNDRIEQKIEINKKVRTNRYRAPKSSIEKEIAALWKAILDIKRAGNDDNFFELGGQSIKALQLVTQLKEKYKINLELKFVFANQTIEEQSKEIENIIWISGAEGIGNGEEMII